MGHMSVEQLQQRIPRGGAAIVAGVVCCLMMCMLTWKAPNQNFLREWLRRAGRVAACGALDGGVSFAEECWIDDKRKMTEKKTGGWLSSVVGNISGLWSRSPNESAVTSEESIYNRNSSLNSSYEEQAESDVGEEDDGIIVETVCAEKDITPKRRTVRYLSPSALLAATRSTTAFDKETLTNVTRKRAATGYLFQDDMAYPNVGNSFTTSSMTEPIAGRFSTKRSRIQRDFTEEKSFLSSSLSDAPGSGKSHLSQSFASPFTPLNSSVMRPKVSRPYSAVSSSLSSKTRAILEQLEKISSPVKEVKRLSSLNINGPERWATDTISSTVQKPPRNSMCALSRAQLISNLLATKSTSPFWGRPAYSTKMAVSSATSSSQTVQTSECSAVDTEQEEQDHESDKVLPTKSSILVSPKRADFPRKLEREKILLDNNTEKSKVTSLPTSTSITKTSDIIAPQRSSSAKSTNVFSARDLGVVSPVKEMTRSEKEKVVTPTKIDGAMFAFAPPMKRGPSTCFCREETPSKTSRSVPFSAKTSVPATAMNIIDSFPSLPEGVPKQNEEQRNTTDKDKETQPVTEVSLTVKPADNDSTTSDALSVKQSFQKSEQWPCPKCMVFNNADIEKCVCCGYEKSVEVKPWTCSGCWISNKSDDDKCAACGTLKHSNNKAMKQADASAQSTSSASVFGDRTFKPLPSASGISFGFSATKPVTDGINLSSTKYAPLTTSSLNSGIVVNGSATSAATRLPMKFGLSSASLAPSFGVSKASETSPSLPTVTEEQPLMSLSSQPSAPTLTFGVPAPSLATTVPCIPSLTRSSFSFPTLTVTTSVATTLPPSGNTFSVPISTSVNPFMFGSSTTTTAEANKVSAAPLFSFGSSAPFLAVTSAETTVAPLSTFGTTLPAFSIPKAPLFGTSNEPTSSPGVQDVIEMSSPTTSPVTAAAAVGPFGTSKSSTPSLFSFGASNTSSSTSTGGLFGNLHTTTQNSLSAPSTSLFSFAQQQQMPVTPKPFEPPASLTSPPSTFNFGATASNGTGFIFGSTAPPANFAFGAQQPVNNAASTTFSFVPAAPTPPFGNVRGTAPAPNFFTVGSTSSTTARKMLKARRMRK
uniref:RanBP2-type domain-containing protein n=1 Tax=Setaria digitata TaxID=48799 RepID=A0A915Q693_9BILA